MEQPSPEPSSQSSSPKPTEQPQTPSSSSSSAYTNPTTAAAAAAATAPPSTTQPLPTQSATSSSPSPSSASLTPQSTQQFTPSQARPPFNRPWQQQQPSNFSHHPTLLQAHSSTNSSSPALSVPSAPRGGITIGVPAHHPGVATQSGTFSSMNALPYGPSSGGMGRNVSESALPSSSSQVGQPMGVGMMGAPFGSSSAMRPSVLPPHQLRPVQSTGRPQSPSTPSFQGHGMIRVPSVSSPGSPSPNIQSLVPQNQPWLSSGTQGKPPLPPTSLRPQMSAQSVHQRPHLSHPHHLSMPASPQQQQVASTQQPPQPQPPQPPQQPQQPPTSGLSQEQYPQSRIQQSSPTTQQQIGRIQGTGILRPQSAITSGGIQPGVLNRPAAAEAEETCDRILSKRSIQEILAQVDPSEKLDPDVEDILVDIADDFIESITTFGCSLAKHRKSTTLEAKDILLHLERNWSMTIPGFGGDEIRTYKKPLTTDIHRERLAAIKKSILNADVTHSNPKGSAAQTSGNAKGHPAKGPSFVGSPALKLREPA